MSSARSVSIAWMPSRSRASLRSISSVASDLTLMTSSAPLARAMPATIALASAPSRAQCTVPPARVTDASRRSSCSGSVAIVRALICAPAARSASQSSSSATTARRLVADRRRRLAEVAPQLRVAQRAPGGLGEVVGLRRSAHSWAARISARCIVRVPARCAAQARRRCACRHDASAAAHTSARVSRTWRSLSESIADRRVGVLDRERAAEAAALARPPRARRGRCRARRAAAAAARSPTCSARSEWHVGW